MKKRLRDEDFVLVPATYRERKDLTYLRGQRYPASFLLTPEQVAEAKAKREAEAFQKKSSC